MTGPRGYEMEVPDITNGGPVNPGGASGGTGTGGTGTERDGGSLTAGGAPWAEANTTEGRGLGVDDEEELVLRSEMPGPAACDGSLFGSCVGSSARGGLSFMQGNLTLDDCAGSLACAATVGVRAAGIDGMAGSVGARSSSAATGVGWVFVGATCNVAAELGDTGGDEATELGLDGMESDSLPPPAIEARFGT